MNIALRWLGTAGVEVRAGSETLLIDPYLTRVSLRQMLFGRLNSNKELLEHLLPGADVILVSHAHFDHLLDVPALAQQTGAPVYGSLNTCRLLHAAGVSAQQIHQACPGDSVEVGTFQIQVYVADHERILGYLPYHGDVCVSTSPQRAAEYRLDIAYMYQIRVAGRTFLFTGSAGPAPAIHADLLLLGSTGRPKFYQALIQATTPHAAMLIHWDDFWQPLSRPLRPITYPPLKVVDPHALAHQLHTLAPALRVLIPEPFRAYSVEELGIS